MHRLNKKRADALLVDIAVVVPKKQLIFVRGLSSVYRRGGRRREEQEEARAPQQGQLRRMRRFIHHQVDYHRGLNNYLFLVSGYHFHFLTMHTPLGHPKTQNHNNLYHNLQLTQDP